MNGPILDVNNAGAIEKRLDQNSETKNIVGTFGVFHIGTAKIVTKDTSGVILTEGTTHNITPLEKLIIDESIELPAEMALLEIVVYDYSGKEVGSINSITSDQLTSMEAQTETLPENLTLLQNYPNPFNPSTVISWQLAVSSYVELSIYNSLGQKITTLVSERQNAGIHKVEWDARGFASGIYLYKLTSVDGYSITKKLVLLK